VSGYCSSTPLVNEGRVMLTRVGLENERVRVFLEMLRNGATKEEAFAYIELIYPFEEPK
jgi:hypothetical protein